MSSTIIPLMAASILGVSSSASAQNTVPPVPPPPPTEARPVTDTIHGSTFTDNFRWLEGDNADPANMGAMTDEVAAWTDQQNARTRQILDNLPGRKELEIRFRPLLQIGSVSSPSMRGSRYFYTKREGTQNQPRIFMREGPGGSGESRLLVDPAQIDPTGLTAIGGISPSQDGTLLGIGLYRAGDENTTVYVIDVDSGAWLPTKIEGKAGIIQWMPDNSGFFYEKLADVKNPYSAQIRFHRLGTNPVGDPLLFRQYTTEENEKLATTWGPGANISRDCRWMALAYWTGTSSNDLWVIDLAKWWSGGQVGKGIPGGGVFEMREVSVGANANFFGSVETVDGRDALYILTDYKAPNKRLVSVDLAASSLEADGGAWKDIIPERNDTVLTSAQMAKGVFVAEYEEKAQSRLALYSTSGQPIGDLRLPGIGSAGISTEYDRTEAFVSFTSFNYPTTIFRVDLANPDAEPAVWERPDVPVDPSIVEVKQVTYTSKDGTPVTMFIVHKKGLSLDGDNPTILTGYGGFNISQTPFFSATMFPWLEAGGVYAMPNLRGGGEYGKTWHEGGKRENKQNVFDDFYAAAQYLFDNNYTRPQRLAISGGSNGGLLTGTAVVQKPEMFAAAIVAVPLLDMLRYQSFLMARYWVPEYGSVDEPGDEGAKAAQWLKAYSPYQQIKSGVTYPAVMVTTGENDTRVHPMHARKFAAALQAATGPNAVNPVLLWVDRDGGHGAGKPLNLRLRDAVDSRIFVMWRLGMLDKPEE